jgi:uncharacterized metal-binding protein YceD (DUF177 family)
MAMELCTLKININTLNPTVQIDLKGDEAWLQQIYKSFEEWAGNIDTPIEGALSLSKDDYGFVQVKGSIAFTPKLPCSRCSDPIAFPIEIAVSTEFRPYNKDLPSDYDLQKEELDYYYVDKDGNVDVEGLVNDLIQTSIPSKIVLTTDGGSACKICPNKFTDSKVFGSEPSEDDNPFAILKNIKLDS